MTRPLHFKPSQFIHDVRSNDFNSNEYDAPYRLRLLAAKAAFLKLPQHEQENLARTADRLPGRTARSYGTITAFESLVAIAFAVIEPQPAVEEALERMVIER